MNRRQFMKTTGLAVAGAPFWMGLLPEALWGKLPSRIRITGLKTMIVEDEVYLKVFTDQGIVGEGHTTVHRKSPTCEAAVKDLARVLVGRDPTRIEFLWHAMYRWPRWRGGPVLNAAISGVDLALWDILGKLLDAPVYRLLGGAARIRRASHLAWSRAQAQRGGSEEASALKSEPRGVLRRRIGGGLLTFD